MRKYILFFLILISFSAYSQNVSVCSWNLQNFGKSKSDAGIIYMAEILRKFDVVAIQEVVAGYGGSRAVARLADELNRLGSKWDYVVSDPTSSMGNGKERYAFIWNTSKIKKKGAAWLEQNFESSIEREPLLCRFEVGKRVFTLVSFHAVPKSKQPETEIKYFKFLPGLYPGEELIFCGDFNLPQSHTVFNPLKKMGYVPALVGQKTSLKQRAIGSDSLASEYDNFFFNAVNLKLRESGIVHFYQDFETLQDARLISDHVPIYLNFSFPALAK